MRPLLSALPFSLPLPAGQTVRAAAPTGRWRYDDGLVYFLGLLQTGGRFTLQHSATHQP